MSALDELIARDSGAQPSALDAIIASDSAGQPTSVPASRPSVPAVQPQNWMEQQLAHVNIPQGLDPWLSRIRGLAMGAADPSVGIAQTAANLPFIRDIPTGPKSLGDLVAGKSGTLGDSVNAAIDAKNATYEQDRAASGRSGIDLARLVGNFTSPTNLLAAKLVPGTAGASIPKLAGIGAAVGAGSAATMPVSGEDGSDFWATKSAQAAGGAAGGAILTPALSKVFDAAAPYIVRAASAIFPGDAAQSAAQASMRTDSIIEQALKDTGQNIADIPQPQMQALRDQVTQALRVGKQVDPAALMRKGDFDTLGIQPLQGQITRDPTQFATERNLRGVGGVGGPIMGRLTEQNQKLQGLVGALRGQPAENYEAGSAIADATASIDKSMRGSVTQAYTAARNAAGKDLDVPLSGVAQDYAQVLNDFGDKVPSGVRNNFEALGLMTGNQKKTFSIEDVDRLQKVINSNWSNDPATNLALGKLNTSLKTAVNSVDASGGPFAGPVELARQRFQLQEAVPALKAAGTGSVSPDDFVRRFVVGGKTDEVKTLASLLQKYSPEAYQQARSQIGDTISRAAFGENPAGDSIFTPARYADAIRKLGTSKLSAFYSPAEIDQLKTIGRVGSYINSVPTAAPVNYSNTSSALGNLLNGGIGLLPGGKYISAIAQNARQTVVNNGAVANALNTAVPVTNSPLPPKTREALARMLVGSGVAIGGAIQ